VVPALSAPTLAETVCPDPGLVVVDATEWKEPPGQAGTVVLR
jgi:hypothetical protein